MAKHRRWAFIITFKIFHAVLNSTGICRGCCGLVIGARLLACGGPGIDARFIRNVNCALLIATAGQSLLTAPA